MKRIILCLCLALAPALGWTASAEDPANLEQLRSSAQQGDAEAMLELGILYEYGYRLKDHNPPALAWYRLAAEAGNTKAGARHDALKAKLSGQEIEEANKLYAEYSANMKKPVVNTTPAPSAPAAPANATEPAAPAKADAAATAPTPAAEPEKKSPSSESK